MSFTFLRSSPSPAQNLISKECIGPPWHSKTRTPERNFHFLAYWRWTNSWKKCTVKVFLHFERVVLFLAKREGQENIFRHWLREEEIRCGVLSLANLYPRYFEERNSFYLNRSLWFKLLGWQEAFACFPSRPHHDSDIRRSSTKPVLLEAAIFQQLHLYLTNLTLVRFPCHLSYCILPVSWNKLLCSDKSAVTASRNLSFFHTWNIACEEAILNKAVPSFSPCT